MLMKQNETKREKYALVHSRCAPSCSEHGAKGEARSYQLSPVKTSALPNSRNESIDTFLSCGRLDKTGDDKKPESGTPPLDDWISFVTGGITTGGGEGQSPARESTRRAQQTLKLVTKKTKSAQFFYPRERVSRDEEEVKGRRQGLFARWRRLHSPPYRCRARAALNRSARWRRG